MIIPVGKNKYQVSQGGCKHESLWDNEAFFKGAQGLSGLTEEKETTPNDVDPQLQQAVDDPNGSLGTNPPGADAGQQPVQTDQSIQPQQGGFEQTANRIVTEVMKGLGLDPASWNVDTSVQQQGGIVSGIKINMSRGAAKAVAKI